MQFGHEQLDGYRISIRYVTWAYQVAKSLKGNDRPARDQLLRASPSIPLNIAEGNGKGTNADRRRCFEIARGSASECVSIQDCLDACEGLAAAQSAQGNGHGFSATPDNVSGCRHDRFPHPGPLPGGRGGIWSALCARLSP
jgi:four helix bundle protein